MATQNVDLSLATEPKPGASRARNRLYLIAIFAAFLLPLLLSWILVGLWRPAESVHNGELLTPALPVTALQAQSLDGTALDENLLRGRWTVAYLAPEDCSETCRETLYNMRQIRLASGGKNIDRVQTLLLLPQRPASEFQNWLADEHAAMTKAISGTINNESSAVFLRQAFTDDAGASATTAGMIYLFDPLGNLVMRYGTEVEPRGLLDDLKRLLKLSRIG